MKATSVLGIQLDDQRQFYPRNNSVAKFARLCVSLCVSPFLASFSSFWAVVTLIVVEADLQMSQTELVEDVIHFFIRERFRLHWNAS